jgi:hypothetical protein
MTIATLQRNVASVIKNIDELVLGSAMENDNIIVDLNTSQLSEGLRSDGGQIEPEYFSPVYAKFKKAIGAKPPLGTPNLFLEGNFYRGFYAKKVNDWIEIHSSDWKEKKLREKYSDEIFGLTESNKSELSKLSLPNLLKNIRNELYKN